MTSATMDAGSVRTRRRLPSGLFDRLVVGAMLIALATAGSFVALTALGAVQPDLVLERWPPLAEVVASAAGGSPLHRMGTAFGATLASLACLLLALRQLRARGGVAAGHHLVEADERGIVLVDDRSVEAIAMYAALSTPEVLESAVRVSGSGVAPVRLHVEAGTHGRSSLRDAGAACAARVRSAVEEIAGVAVRDVSVDVYVADATNFVRRLP